MTTNTPLRATQIDLLESLPGILGHTPHNSVVLVMIDHDAGGLIALTVRIDLPSEIHEVASTIAGLHDALSDKQVQWTGATIVVWDEGVERNALYAEVMKATRQMVLEMGREVYGAFHVGATHISGVDPTGQVDVERDPSRGDRVTLQAMIAGRAPLTSREAVAATVEAPSPDEIDAERALRILEDTATSTREAALPIWRDVIDNGVTEDTDLTLLVTSIAEDRELRDGLIMYAGAADPEFLTMVLPSDIGGTLREWMHPLTHQERLERVEHLRELATRIQDELAVPTLTMLAMTAHEARLSLLAIVALERAERIEPNYRLAALTRKMTEHGIYATEVNYPAA